MQKVTLVLLVLVIAALGWVYYDSHQQLQQAHAQTATLEQEVARLQQELTGLQQQVETLRNNHTVEGIVRQANNAILDGWESLVIGVEKELQKARQQAEQAQRKDNSEPVRQTAPAAEPQ